MAKGQIQVLAAPYLSLLMAWLYSPRLPIFFDIAFLLSFQTNFHQSLLWCSPALTCFGVSIQFLKQVVSCPLMLAFFLGLVDSSKCFAWSKALHSLLVIYGVSLSCQARKSIVWEELPLGLCDGDLLIWMASMRQLKHGPVTYLLQDVAILFLEDQINAFPLQRAKSIVNQYFLVFIHDTPILIFVSLASSLYFIFDMSESIICTRN